MYNNKKSKIKYSRHLGTDCERTLYGIWKIKPNYKTMTCSTIQRGPHLIWPSSNKEIWIFVKQVISPFLPSFVTWRYVGFTGRLCSQKTGLQTYSNFMHTSLTKVVPDNLKACQICNHQFYHNKCLKLKLCVYLYS